MIITVQEDEQGLYIELPPDLMEDLGWDESTELVWTIDDDGKVKLGKSKHDSSDET
jgi:hypothetical protein